MFLNVHSHFPPQKGEWVIQSLWKQFEKVQTEGFFSLGIHPRYIEDDGLRQFADLQKWGGHPKVVAIGECGLDRRAHTDLTIQSELFSRQIQLAMELQKPLVIHCVRAWEDVFLLLRRGTFTLPVVFHGFNKGLDMAMRIVERGYYLSMGAWVEKERIGALLPNIPLDRLFLETDAVSVPIEQIYETVAKTYKMPINSLSLQIMENARRVFGETFLSV